MGPSVDGTCGAAGLVGGLLAQRHGNEHDEDTDGCRTRRDGRDDTAAALKVAKKNPKGERHYVSTIGFRMGAGSAAIHRDTVGPAVDSRPPRARQP